MHRSRSYIKDLRDGTTFLILMVIKVTWFILQSVQWLPICNNWEDFFDFSRWNFTRHQPKDKVIAFFLHRIRVNVVHNFGGNYCWSLLSAMILSGILFDLKLLLNTFIGVALWLLTSILTMECCFLANATYFVAESFTPAPSYKLGLLERFAVTMFLWHISVFHVGGLSRTYMVLISAVCCCCVHAAGRPILPAASKQQFPPYEDGQDCSHDDDGDDDEE